MGLLSFVIPHPRFCSRLEPCVDLRGAEVLNRFYEYQVVITITRYYIKTLLSGRSLAFITTAIDSRYFAQ